MHTSQLSYSIVKYATNSRYLSIFSCHWRTLQVKFVTHSFTYRL